MRGVDFESREEKRVLAHGRGGPAEDAPVLRGGDERSVGIRREERRVRAGLRPLARAGGADPERDGLRRSQPGWTVTSTPRGGFRPARRTDTRFFNPTDGRGTEGRHMKKRNVGRPRDGDPAETRREILRAAEESFAASGFVGATTRQVAARAGVNVATLHYHFGNKERLYRAVLDAAVAGEVPEAGKATSPADRLTGSRGGALELRLDAPLAAPAQPPPPPGRARPRARTARTRRSTTRARSSSSGRSRTWAAKGGCPPADVARFVLTLMDGALVAARNGHGADAPAPETPRRAVVAAALKRRAVLKREKERREELEGEGGGSAGYPLAPALSPFLLLHFLEISPLSFPALPARGRAR